MCELCQANNDEMTSCQDCGRLICFDAEPDDVDVIDQAYVTASGDLFCRRCGSRYDEEEEDEWDDCEVEYGPDPIDDWEDGR